MNDQYRLTDAPPPAPPEPRRRTSPVDKLLWVALIVGAVFNSGFQMAGDEMLAIPFGAVTVVAGIALIVRFIRGRSTR
ncbi:hypothetical protein [Glycomyces buryatensis]|uniref:Uncharacterized protein n=1 Tax=Glycomyces buryatensis TaxID=2570927 RepID=A0A4V4HS20_9ACTN|nr:hypothetical protein [Glycomyces buryatensis]THV39696.1 hypothetical protein FAB82_17105 [Glycomyces buryatensis]